MLKKIKRIVKAKLLSAKPNGQYRFLLHKWESIMDFDLANAILQSEYFRNNLVPLPVETSKFKKVVVFAPHQDDESIGCGGILSYLSNQSCKIHLVFLTDGRPLGENAEDNVKERHQEAKQVAQHLNATMHEIGLNNVTLEVNQQHLDMIRAVVDEEVDAVFTVWPLDNPPKHRICNAIIAQALKTLQNQSLQILNYSVHTALVPNVYFDYTIFFAEKQSLIGFHKSQMKTQNYAHISSGLDAWNSRYLSWSVEERFVEIFTQMPLREWLKLIEKYAEYPDQAFKGNESCIKAFRKLNRLN